MTPEYDKSTDEMGHSEALVYITKLRAANSSLIAQVEALTVPQVSTNVSAMSMQSLCKSSGWKYVPIELTDDMLIAFAETWYSKKRCIDDCEMADCYAAMLAAAPTIPAIPGTKEGA